MAVFLEVVTDAFEEVLNSQKDKRTRDARTSSAGRRVARRPLRGIEIKDDTAAAVKVIKADGTEIPLVDSSSPDGETTSGYANFILQSVQEQRMEKHQIVETFGQAYVFFFGESPRFLNVQALILNTHDFNWEAEWWDNYERYFRGTKLVEMGARLYMFYDDNIVEGYMINASAIKMAEQPYFLQMTFTLFLTNYRNVSFIGDPRFPVRASAMLPEGVELTNASAGEALLTAYGTDARNAASTGSVGALGAELHDLINEGGFGQKTRLTSFLRSIPATLGISPDTQRALNSLGGQGVADLVQMTSRAGKPIRGRIADNIDEYIGQPGSAYFQFEPGGKLPSSMTPTIRDAYEVNNLLSAATRLLSCYGIGIDEPRVAQSLGLVPRGLPHGGATFTPAPVGGFGVGLGAAYGYGANASIGGGFGSGSLLGGGVSISAGVGQPTDPLGAVYGRSAQDDHIKDNRFTIGAGDSSYGLTSDYAPGPGYGQAGYGQGGGQGYGSGQGAGGDPGFQDPSNALEGVTPDNRSALQRFLAAKQDTTQFGNGLDVSNGLIGSASFPVAGKASAFAFVALEGSLNVLGNARAQPATLSAITQRRDRGAGVYDPYGVSCTQPESNAGERVFTTGNQSLSSIGVNLTFP